LSPLSALSPLTDPPILNEEGVFGVEAMYYGEARSEDSVEGKGRNQGCLGKECERIILSLPTIALSANFRLARLLLRQNLDR